MRGPYKKKPELEKLTGAILLRFTPSDLEFLQEVVQKGMGLPLAVYIRAVVLKSLDDLKDTSSHKKNSEGGPLLSPSDRRVSGLGARFHQVLSRREATERKASGMF